MVTNLKLVPSGKKQEESTSVLYTKSESETYKILTTLEQTNAILHNMEQNDITCKYRKYTKLVFQNSNVLNNICKKFEITSIKPYPVYQNNTTDRKNTLTSIAEKIITNLANEKNAAKVFKRLIEADIRIYYHSLEVMCLTMIMAQYAGYSEKTIYEIGMAAVTHEVGKIFLPHHILHSNKIVSYKETLRIKQVPLLSAAVVKKTQFATPNIVAAIISHQENFIGTGYPFAKMQKEIHPYGMLIHVADDYDTISIEQNFTEKCGVVYAKSYIRKMTYRRYSNTAVAAFNLSTWTASEDASFTSYPDYSHG